MAKTLTQPRSLQSHGLGVVLPKRIDHRSLTSLQEHLVKTGGWLLKHARRYRLLLAEGRLTATGCSGPFCGGSDRCH
jgi:hypothetical protein